MSDVARVSAALISDARLRRLLADTHGDELLADELFRWNVAASGAAMESVHVFELVLRNALDREMRVWHQGLAGTPDWLLQPHPLVFKAVPRPKVELAVAQALKVARERGRPRTHDDVIAQMSLGVWRYLLPSSSNAMKRKLWDLALYRAFSYWPGEWDPQSIVARVATAHELRNRVAHLEPLHLMDLRKARRDMRSVLHAIGPDAARLFVDSDRLIPTIETNPLGDGAA